jgi:hypothetical protein
MERMAATPIIASMGCAEPSSYHEISCMTGFAEHRKLV